MPTTFRPYQPDQSLLLPPDLRVDRIGCRKGIWRTMSAIWWTDWT